MREEIDPSAPIGIREAIRSSELPRRGFGQRVLAALSLDESLYEEVESDPNALLHAFAVVALASFTTGLGYSGLLGVKSMVLGILTAAVTWLLWSVIVWVIGVKVFGQTSNLEELLRTLGFVAAPQLLYALMIVPSSWFRSAVALVVLVMTLVAFVRATRCALDVDTARGLLIAGLCILVHIVFGALVSTLSILA